MHATAEVETKPKISHLLSEYLDAKCAALAAATRQARALDALEQAAAAKLGSVEGGMLHTSIYQDGEFVDYAIFKVAGGKMKFEQMESTEE
jgi:hypothetical protein